MDYKEPGNKGFGDCYISYGFKGINDLAIAKRWDPRAPLPACATDSNGLTRDSCSIARSFAI